MTRRVPIADTTIKFYSEYQRNWAAVVEPLPRGKYALLSTDILGIPGDAPKDFIKIKEYIRGHSSAKQRNWVGYIAKVGSKDYPNESITEHLLTRIGQACGLNIAESQLRMVGRQVRFLSKYFLRVSKESLVHGIEVFKSYLESEELVDQIAQNRVEQEFYTFQVVCDAVRETFPECHEELMSSFVEMLAFDTLVGHNDRHPANWGIVVPLLRAGKPCFAPVYDTARALFWNVNERRVRQMLGNRDQFVAYIRKSFPQVGWDGWEGTRRIDHFELMDRIFRGYPRYRPHMAKFLDCQHIAQCGRILEAEFAGLMTEPRRTLIVQCLSERQRRFREVVG